MSFAKITSLCITRASKKKLQKPRKETQNTKKCYHSSKSKKVTSNPAAKVVLLLKTNEEPKAALQRMGTDVDFKAQDKEYDVPNIFTPRRATSQITIRFSTPTLCAPCHPLSPCIQHRSSPKFLLTSPLTSLSSARTQ